MNYIVENLYFGFYIISGLYRPYIKDDIPPTPPTTKNYFVLQIPNENNLLTDEVHENKKINTIWKDTDSWDDDKYWFDEWYLGDDE